MSSSGPTPPAAPALPLRSRQEVERLIEDNRGLVGYCIDRWFRSIPARYRDELAAVALVGLWEAAETFDPAQASFSTWASWKIRAQVGREASKLDLIRLPAYLQHEDREAARPGLLWLGDTTDARGQEIPLPDRDRSEGEAREEKLAEVRQAIARLPARLRKIVLARLDGASLDEVGAAFGVSKERIRQLQKRATARLRELLGVAA